MKKSLSLLVAIAMVFSMFATLVSADEKTAGEKLQGYGIINGTSDGLAEDQDWVRKDVAVLVARLLGKVEEASTHENTHGFEDLDSKFYNGYVSWAKEEGFFTGKTATVFGPNDSITNVQFAAVLLRVLNALEGKEGEVDYSQAFETAVELKLISADLEPTDNAVRGSIYEALVTSLDYKIGGKKIGTILGLAGYEITDVAVVSAKATNSKTVVVEFNQEIGDVLASNFVISDTENNNVQVISEVSKSESTATIKLVDSLKNGDSYIVSVSGVVSKDGSVAQGEESTSTFTYAKAVAATVEIPNTTVAYDAVVGIVIKDAAGNDITADFDLSDANIVDVTSSATGVVAIDSSNQLVAQDLVTETGYSVVNVVVTVDVDEDVTIESGNTVIKVQSSVAVITDVKELTLGTLGEDAVTSLFEDETGILSAKVVDSGGNQVSPSEETFRSSNPTVLVVDATTGAVSPVKPGSATVNYTAKFNGKTITKSVVITVKKEAALSSIDVDKSSVKVVLGSGLTETVKVTAKDQYGDALKNANPEISIKANKDDVINGHSKVGVTSTVNNDGEYSILIDADAAVTDATSATLTVQVGTHKKTISVSFVKAAALAGYIAEPSATKLDINPALNAADENAIDDKDATFTVYEKDTNGNKIAVVPSVQVTVTDENLSGGAVSVNAAGLISTVETGSEKVTVSVNGVKVGTFTIQVVNTAKTLSKVVQVKNALTVASGDDVDEALFGTNDNGGAFVGYNQYGGKIQFASGDYTVYTANKDVVTTSGVAASAGTVLLTVVVNGNVYTITVKVTA